MSVAIPSLLHGPVREVRPAASRAVKAFVAGQPWQEAFGAERTPVEALDGLVILDGPSPLLPGVHIQLFLPFKLLVEAIVADRVAPERQEAVFTESLAEPWSTLGLLSPAARLLVLPPQRRRPVLDAAIRDWPAFEALGPRFTTGLAEGSTLWWAHSNLPYLLSEEGVPKMALAGPLPAGGPAALLADRDRTGRGGQAPQSDMF